MLSAAKYPKRNKISITDIREKPVNFFYCLTRASDLVSAIIFGNSGSFAKVSVPVHNYNSLFGTRTYNRMVYFKYETMQFMFQMLITFALRPQ